MKIKHLFLAVCMIGTTSMFAQEVDKDVVVENAEAGQAAGEELQQMPSWKDNWKFDGSVGLNAAATGLVNWAAGGNNNVNGVAFGKLHLLYQKDAIAWETNFDTDFGLSYIDQPEDPFQKSSDNIKLATKFGWEFHKDFYLTVLGSFQSQYAIGRNYKAGYNNIISKWLAPSVTDISVGIDYKHSVNGADFSVYVSPVAGRIMTAYIGDKWNDRYTKDAYLGGLQDAYANAEDDATKALAKAALDAAEATYNYSALVAANADMRTTLKESYGVYRYNDDGTKNYDRNARVELGLNIKGGVAYKYEKLTLGTTVSFFTPYAGKGFSLKDIYEKANGAGSWDSRDVNANYFEYSNMNRQFGHFDVDWDFNISYQFLEVLNVTLSTSLKYYNGTLIADKNGDLSERVQFKSVLGVGIGYSF